MDSVHSHRPGGLPGWLMWAMIPVMVAAGFVSGMALAVYRPEGMAESPAPTQSATETVQAPVTGGPAGVPQQDSSWRIVTGATATHPEAEPNLQDELPPPPRVKFTGTPGTIMEARLALQSDFSEYRTPTGTIAVEYQQMRQATSGISLVGLIHAHDYEDWSTALRTDPEGLKHWLESAARRVQQASTHDRFHLSWAIVDVVRDPPEHFGPTEVTLLDNRSYLVTRPLASTVDHTKTDISLRPLVSLERAAAGERVTSNDPWAAYGPLLRFDATDIYRPERMRGAQPLTP